MKASPFGDVTKLPVQAFLLMLAATGIVGVVALFATRYYWVALLPPAVLLVMLALGRFPRLGYLLIVFLMPFENVVHLAGSEVLTLPKLIGIWLVMVAFMTLLLKRGFARGLRSNLWVPLLVLVLLNLVSALASAYPQLAFDELRKLATASIFFGLSLVYISRRDFESILPRIVIASIFLSLSLFAVDYVMGVPLGLGGQSLFPRSSDPAAALTSSYSGMIIFTLPLLWHSFLKRRTVIGRLLHLAVAAVFLSGAVYLRSRAAALLFIVTLLALSVEYGRRIKPKMLGFIISIASLGVVALLVFTPGAYWMRQRSVVQPATDASVSRRLTYLTVAWEAFKDSPVLGTGPGSFKELYARSPYPPLFSEFAGDYRRYAHNTYLEVLVGSGLVSMLMLVTLILLALRNFRRARTLFREKGQEELVSLVGAYRISLVILSLMFLFISHLYMKYFWMTLALSTLALRQAEKESGGPEAESADGSSPAARR